MLFYIRLLDAKCPECNDRAQVSDDMTTIKCKKCGYSDSYQNYIEKMKTYAENLADNYQFKGNV
jgi:Zn ribbon nucleic-acid-binding protein